MHVLIPKLLHFALLHYALEKLLQFALKILLHFASTLLHFALVYILRQFLLRFALILHFAAIITFCGVTACIQSINLKEKRTIVLYKTL